jgi:hypothetical protein
MSPRVLKIDHIHRLREQSGASQRSCRIENGVGGQTEERAALTVRTFLKQTRSFPHAPR